MKTGLMLIDVINDFFHPDGPNYYPEYEVILENIKTVLSWARQNQVPVIHAMESHIPGEHPDFEWRKLPVHTIQGSFTAQPGPGIEIRSGEYVVPKRRYSAFFATDLDLLLREAGIERLLVAGVKTHVCIRATVQDAFGYGYDTAVIREAVGSNHTHLHEASMEDIERYMGRLVSMADVHNLMLQSDD